MPLRSTRSSPVSEPVPPLAMPCCSGSPTSLVPIGQALRPADLMRDYARHLTSSLPATNPYAVRFCTSESQSESGSKSTGAGRASIAIIWS